MNNLNVQSIKPILEESGVEFAGIFGSRAQGKESANSDIDILVRFRKPTSLSKFARLKRNLHEKLQMPVDLVTEQSLSPYLKDQVLKDLRTIYGTR